MPPDLPTPWVSAAELSRHLPGSDEPWTLLDARFDLADPAAGERAFREAHVPGARFLHLERDLSRPRTATEGRHPLPARHEAAARFAGHGVRAACPVVVMDAGNALFASRAWWMLRELGHPDVRVLAGGLAAWRASGFAVATGDAAEAPPGDFVASPAGTPGFAQIDAATLWARLCAGTGVAIDARAPERYAGITEPLDPVAGHIPGARNLPYAALLTPAGMLLPPAELRARILAALDDTTSPQAALLYCGSGVTACALHLAFSTAGLADATGPTVYPGSWSEWCRDPSRPVATGASP